MMQLLRILLLVIAISGLLQPIAKAAEVLNNEAIISMVKAGLGEDLIVNKIKTTTGQYNTSTDSLIKLKAAGVSDKIIQAMMSAPSGASPTSPPAAQAPAPATLSPAPTTAASLPSGMVVQGQSLFVKANDRVLEVLPVTAEVVHSMAKHFIPYYFGPGDNWHLVRGQKAVVRLPKGKPSFYTKVNPSSFQLMRLTYDSERNFRYVVSTGATYKGTLSFTSNRLSDDTFELVPGTELDGGEYAFVAGGTFYDFGIE